MHDLGSQARVDMYTYTFVSDHQEMNATLYVASPLLDTRFFVRESATL